ncbi:MAG: insulinase family protein [Anaerolineae bacterium]|nr:insulinase family protein [Anaerolineae bacterium]
MGLGLDWRQVQLPNGLHLITIARPGTPVVAVRVYVRAGSRYDFERELSLPGLAHFTEHLLFKSTQQREQREIFAMVERLGGELEAGTTKEYTTFYAVIPPYGLEAAIAILAEVLTRPGLRQEDVWPEKLVVLEEIRRAQDGQGILIDHFAETLWQVHPLRYPALGTSQGLYDLDHESLYAFYRQRYVAGNMLLLVCGDIEHEAVERQVAEHFAALLPGAEQPPLPVQDPPLEASRVAHIEKDINQVYLLAGVPTVSMKHPDRSALKLIERVLGMGGSARLYQRLREQAQLAYSIHTVMAQYEDAGYFAVYTGCAPENVTQVLQVIFEEWDRLRQQGVSEDELRAAKGNYAGTLARRFETNLALAGIFGVEGLLHRPESLEDAVARINAVTRDDVLDAARTYLDAERHVLVSVGRKIDE